MIDNAAASVSCSFSLRSGLLKTALYAVLAPTASDLISAKMRKHAKKAMVAMSLPIVSCGLVVRRCGFHGFALAVTLDEVKKLRMTSKGDGQILLVSVEVLEDPSAERSADAERAESVRTSFVAFGCMTDHPKEKTEREQVSDGCPDIGVAKAILRRSQGLNVRLGELEGLSFHGMCVVTPTPSSALQRIGVAVISRRDVEERTAWRVPHGLMMESPTLAFGQFRAVGVGLSEATPTWS